MSEKIDDLIARALPKIAAQGKIESFKRKIAKFAARAWVKGPDKLASYGARVPGKVHAAALEAAEMSEDDDEGGFLDDVRKAFKDDEAFVVVVKSLAKAYAAVLAKKKESAAETGAVTLCLPQDVKTEAFDYPDELFHRRVWTIARPRPDGRPGRAPPPSWPGRRAPCWG